MAQIPGQLASFSGDDQLDSEMDFGMQFQRATRACWRSHVETEMLIQVGLCVVIFITLEQYLGGSGLVTMLENSVLFKVFTTSHVNMMLQKFRVV